MDVTTACTVITVACTAITTGCVVLQTRHLLGRQVAKLAALLNRP